MNEQKNNGRGIFYGVIGVATLVVAIIGATFAYFTATAANNVITGNMATVKLSLDVTKKSTVDESLGGMIPMSNGMVHQAVTNASSKGICVDDNGNAVCQIYKITLTNDSTAGQYVDGYVALKGGSAAPTDYTAYTGAALFPVNGLNAETPSETKVGTTMRWAQVFCTEHTGDDEDTEDVVEKAGDLQACSTTGTQNLGVNSGEEASINAIGNAADAHDTGNIRTDYKLVADNTTFQQKNPSITTDATKGVLTVENIAGTDYAVIGKNYIRVSDHQWTDGVQSYSRETDVTSALVFNHSIAANQGKGTYYIVVWLSETGTNQTPGATIAEGEGQDATTHNNPAAANFFSGNVTFVSAQGSEVSATFTGYARVTATD